MTTQKFIISFLVDHASPEAFFRMIDEGNAPYVTKYILGEKTPQNTYSKASISRHIITGFPSTSANTHVSILTGDYAGKNDMLYTFFWDLIGDTPKYKDTDAVSVSLLKKMNYEYMSTKAKTLFEYFKHSASFHAINRGASFCLFTTWSILTKFFPLLQKLKKKDDPYALNPIAQPELWRTVLTANIGDFLKRTQKIGLPEASFIVFLLSDENAHKFGFGSKQYREAVQVLDFFVQNIVEGMQDKKGVHIPGIKELGLLDNIVWCINTDHAGRKVFSENFVTINTIVEMELGIKLIEGMEILHEKNLAKIQKDLTKINGFSIVGEGFWALWLGPGSAKTPREFTRYYGEHIFRSIPNKGTKRRGNAEAPTEDIIAYLLEKPYTQFIFIPEEDVSKPLEYPVASIERVAQPIPRSYSIKVLSSRGVAVFERSFQNSVKYYSYKVLQGEDPLFYNELKIQYGEKYSANEWLRLTNKSAFPDVFHRMYGHFDSVYAPNCIVTCEKNYEFWSLYLVHKKMKKALLDVQTHDGLTQEESCVPLTFAGPGIKKGFEIPFGRNVDITPTLLRIMEKDFDANTVDGTVLEEIFEPKSSNSK